MTTTRAEFGIHAAEEIESQEYGKKRTDDDGRRFRPRQIPLHILLIIFSILMFIPFMWMVFSAFKPLDEIFMRPPVMLPSNWTLDGFRTAWEGAPFASAYVNSFLVASLVTILTLLTCAMAAYAFARIRFPGNNVLFGIFLATMMVPFQLTIIPLYIILGQLQWIDTLLALIVPAGLFNAFGVFLMRQYVRGIPLELEEAAAIDGAGRHADVHHHHPAAAEDADDRAGYLRLPRTVERLLPTVDLPQQRGEVHHPDGRELLQGCLLLGLDQLDGGDDHGRAAHADRLHHRPEADR